MSINLEKQTRYVNNGSVCLAAYSWGTLDDAKETIVLIHGYPDSAEVWDRIAEQLADQFNVVAYDVRGTGLSDIPKQSTDYGFDVLVEDLSAVIRSVSPTKPVHLVGHDWGALQGWEAVLGDRLKPQVASYTALAPSADHVGWWFHRQWAQGNVKGYLNVFKRVTASSYMAMLQIPVIPELTWRLGLGKAWPKIVAHLENTTVEKSPTQVKNAMSGLGLYRQNLAKSLFQPTQRKTTIPVHMLLMSKDPFVPLSLSQGMEEWADDIHYSEIAAGHWGILSQPQAVAEKIKSYILNQSQKV